MPKARNSRARCMLGLALLLGSLMAVPAMAEVGEFAQQQRGKYLVAAGDCQACHTASGGALLAGGKGIETPFGTVYSSNITPDQKTGIGQWTGDQFYRLMHQGIAANGSHIYPAMPYPWYTKITRQDSDAIHAYLLTVPAVQNDVPDNKLPWPLDNREAMIGWNALYFKPGTFKPDTAKSETWNRGAYLVQGLGHCGACHSPKNIFGAVEDSTRFQGAEIQNWYAPNLTGEARTGLQGWSAQDIADFLKHGQNDRAIAYGPMAEVVEDSTSKMTDDDLKAIATYLKSLPAAPAGEEPQKPDQAVVDAGRAIYLDSCSACHRSNGGGVPSMFPALAGSGVVQSTSAKTVMRLILNGGHGASTSGSPTSPSMPAFGWKLSDQQIAAVATYVRTAWGNVAAPVATSDVKDLRQAVGTKVAAD